MEIVYTAERYGVGVFGERSDEWPVRWTLDLLRSGGYTVAHASDSSSSNASAEMGRGNN